MAEIKVLYVDDEQQNLNSFRASFRSRYKVYTAISVEVALEVLDKEEIHVIISDQRMPEITGVEFFKITKAKYPQIPRILLTGYTDIEVLAEAVNQGDVYRYITKPWDELELHNSVLNAYDFYKANRALEQKVIELQKANDELNRFIYSLSHELRAPIASAMGVIELVKMENKFGDSGEYWPLMEACTQKLDYYISQALQYYKTTRFAIKNEKVVFDRLVHHLIERFQQDQKSSPIQFEVAIEEDVPFYGDAFRTEIILSNLLSNAIKSPRINETPTWVGIHIITSVQEVSIQVKDNGEGIVAENIPLIFDQFFKGAHPNGSGMGLYILREALEKLHGTVNVQSEPGSGSTFIIKMPNLASESENNT